MAVELKRFLADKTVKSFKSEQLGSAVKAREIPPFFPSASAFNLNPCYLEKKN